MEGKEKPDKIVKTHTVAAAGIASVIAAVFTSSLGVAGTLIGTALTSMLITLGSAVLNAHLEKATTRIAGLPSTVRGRLSTQQLRMPGRPNPEPATTPGDEEKSQSLLERLRSIPSYLRDLPAAGRRRVLLTGALAGLAATLIGLSGVTSIELVGGKTLSCMVWGSCPTETVSGTSEEGGSGSGLSILGGERVRSVEPQTSPADNEQVAPGNEGQFPQQPAEQQPGAGGAAPQQSQDPPAAPQQGEPPVHQPPGGTPQNGVPAEPAPAAPGGGEPASPSEQ